MKIKQFLYKIMESRISLLSCHVIIYWCGHTKYFRVQSWVKIWSHDLNITSPTHEATCAELTALVWPHEYIICRSNQSGLWTCLENSVYESYGDRHLTSAFKYKKYLQYISQTFNKSVFIMKIDLLKERTVNKSWWRVINTEIVRTECGWNCMVYLLMKNQ